MGRPLARPNQGKEIQHKLPTSGMRYGTPIQILQSLKANKRPSNNLMSQNKKIKICMTLCLLRKLSL